MAGIDNIRSGQLLTTNSRSPARTDNNATSNTEKSSNTTAPKQDSVSLSQQSKAIGQMQQSMASQPSFDSAKVAAIKEAIANGSYTVDPEKLADNMIKFEKDLQ